MVPMAMATVVTSTTAPGAELDGLPVSATAVLTTAADELTIEISGLVANPTSIIQALSDFAFFISGGLIATGIASSNAMFVDIAGDGTYTSLGFDSTGWLLDGTGLRLCVLCPGAAGPSQLIIGAPDGGGVYSNANGSITGKDGKEDPHNPFLQAVTGQPVIFVLNVPGLTPEHIAQGKYFSFGTTEGKNVPATEPIPESLPLWYTVIGLGFCGLARIRLRVI